MKKLLSLLLTSVLCTTFSTFAEKTLVECSTNQVFEDNTCHVCFEENVTSDTNVLDIEDIKIPWNNEQDNVAEVAYKIENVVPEVITKLSSSSTPAAAKDVWKFTNPWIGNLNEFVLTTGGETTFLEMNTDAKITITDKESETDKTILVRAPLIYHERTITTPITESEAEKTRNICVMYAAKFGKAPATMSGEVSPPDTSDDPEVVDSAPEEEPAPDPEPEPEIAEEDIPVMNSAGDNLPRATSVETGPAEMLFFVLAGVSSSVIFLLRRKFFTS